MRNFVAIGIVVLIITTAGCITPDENPIEETGRDIGDRNMQRSDEDRQQGIGLQDDDGDGIPNKDDTDFQRGVNRSNNTVNTTRINENNNGIDSKMEDGVNDGITIG